MVQIFVAFSEKLNFTSTCEKYSTENIFKEITDFSSSYIVFKKTVSRTRLIKPVKWQSAVIVFGSLTIFIGRKMALLDLFFQT